VGDSKTPLIAMSVASIVNIVLDVVAVFLLHMGIAGAAIATLIAQLLSGIICMVRICRLPQLRFSRQDLLPDRAVLKNLLHIGIPAAGKNILVSLGGMAVMAVVNTCGTAFIAGFTASNKLYGLLEIAALSYGCAIVTYVGQNYGAMRFDRIRAGMKSATILAVVTAVAISALMFLFGRPITMLFISTENPADAALAGDIAYRYLCVMASCLPVLYILYLLLFALQGLGDTVRPMFSGLIELILRLLVAGAVTYTGYYTGIFGAECAAWIGSTVYLAIHYRKRMKQEI
jgi:Na+-driven multidrug efflux pump